jgi:uncharacterized membrane protein
VAARATPAASSSLFRGLGILGGTHDMPIEFRCPQCDRLLRTPDGTAGKDAKCPQCATIVKIPATPQSPPSAPQPAPQNFVPPVPPPFRETMAMGEVPNPYQSPAATEMRGAAAAPSAGRGFNPTRIELGEVLSRTWNIYKANLGPCIGATLIVMICGVITGAIVGAAFGAVFRDARGAAAIVQFAAQQIVSQGINAFFGVGLIMFMLKIARGEGSDFGALFGGGPFFLFALAIQLLTMAAVGVGLVLLIVPGIIIGLMLSQSLYMLVDQGEDIVGSLRKSIEATTGNKLTLFALYLLAGLAGAIIALITCGIGILFVAPFGALLATVAYLGMTGQATVLDEPSTRSFVERDFNAPGSRLD